MSVLLCICLLSILSYVVVFAVNTTMGYKHEDHGNGVQELVNICAYVLVTMVDTACIYLVFEMNESTYYCLCNRCDAECSKLCHRIAAGKHVPDEVVKRALDASHGDEHASVPPNCEQEDSMEMDQLLQ